MRERNHGGTLAFVAASLMVIILVGSAFFLLSRLIGAGQEIRSATDSGALNVAKNAVKIGVDLSTCSSVAQTNFKGLVDPATGQVDLLTYNRLVAQTILVGLNATAENTSAASDHAYLLRYALKDGGTSPVTGITIPANQAVGNQLYNQLTTAANMLGSFSIAAANSVRMTGDSNQQTQSNAYAVAYAEPNTATNVYWDTSLMPTDSSGNPVPVPANLLVATGAYNSTDPQSNLPYMAGYTDSPILIVDNALGVRGVPLNPNQQPHLLSNVTFAAAQNPAPLQNTFNPPNAYQETGTAKDYTSKQNVNTTASAVAGTLTSTYPAGIPLGFVKIINGAGYGGAANLPTTDNIYNDQLISGIYLATNSSGQVVAFSTDDATLQKWADYNNGKSKSPPPMVDSNGNNIVFNADGSTPTDAKALSKVTSVGSPTGGCFASNLGTGNPCDAELSAFGTAYDTGAAGVQPNSPDSLTAVEYGKQEVIQAYGVAWPEWNTMMNMGFSVQQANIQANVADPTQVSPYAGAPGGPNGYYSGMRYFNPSGNDYIATPVKFSTPADAVTYLTQIASPIVNYDSGKIHGTMAVIVAKRNPPDPTLQAATNNLLNLMYKRVRQIKPSASYAEMITALQSVPLDLGAAAYLYMDQTSKAIVCTATPPVWVTTTVATESPDGNATEVDSQPYDTIPVIANPVGELGAHDVLFYQNPNTNLALVGRDVALWTDSSGFDNLLGTMEFRNYDQGGGTFAQPN